MSWITHSENKLLGDLAISIEKSLMFGKTKDIEDYKYEAVTLLNVAMSQGDITPKRFLQLLKLIGTNQRDNIKMVINILNAKS